MFQSPDTLPYLVSQVGLVGAKLPAVWRSYVSEVIARMVVGLWTWRVARDLPHRMSAFQWDHTEMADDGLRSR